MPFCCLALYHPSDDCKFFKMGNNLVAPEDPVTDKSTDRGYSYTQKLRYAASGMKGLRATMEDKHIYTNEIWILGVEEPLIDHSVFAVFDGHGGDFTSKYAAENFLRVLAKRPEMMKYARLPKEGAESRSDVTGVELIKDALKGAFTDLDKEIRPLQDKKNEELNTQVDPAVQQQNNGNNDEGVAQMEHSGSTCVMVFTSPTHIFGCNAGDSRAILRRGGKVFPLSFDHKPSEVPERERITGAGGFVKARRVDGDLAVSRAFGDFFYKNENGLPPEKQKVIPNPDILVYPRNYAEDEFIVLACDGVWDVASSKQCADFVQQLLIEGEQDLGVICEEALDTCLERNSKDNMTIMIIGFPGMRQAEGHVTLHNAVWGRRRARQTKQLNEKARAIAENLGLNIGITDSTKCGEDQAKYAACETIERKVACEGITEIGSDEDTEISESDIDVANALKTSFQAQPVAAGSS